MKFRSTGVNSSAGSEAYISCSALDALSVSHEASTSKRASRVPASRFVRSTARTGELPIASSTASNNLKNALLFSSPESTSSCVPLGVSSERELAISTIAADAATGATKHRARRCPRAVPRLAVAVAVLAAAVVAARAHTRALRPPAPTHSRSNAHCPALETRTSLPALALALALAL
eukprot:CAMPEP_0185839624 /NCGR_PEP_ID=MMETSP1353-20130828/14895_1 /TAXON_ID=1077150 /ORGANISM="Erythrolobus australicus, Strain CCMP3124" /LENGTH=176 /DNA_ID=CAMNT_0028538827 /DNA_START=478 /DNA_END=1005 /DNA_ORIENTATION=+